MTGSPQSVHCQDDARLSLFGTVRRFQIGSSLGVKGLFAAVGLLLFLPAGAAPGAPAEPGHQFLPDDAVLARVNGRAITVRRFRERYFGSEGSGHFDDDSAGRVALLNHLIGLDVLGLTALASKRALDLEDRQVLRGHTNTVLQNVLYQRQVVDSAAVEPEEIDRYMVQFGYEQHLRSILVESRSTAERLRLDLLRGRVPWGEVVRRHSRARGMGPEGDLGWLKRGSLQGEMGLVAFGLEPGAISKVLEDSEGYRIFQCLGRRAVSRSPTQFARVLLMRDLRQTRMRPLVLRFYDKVRALAGVTYDTTNIRWVTARFKEAYDARPVRAPGTLDLSDDTPEFGADTGRVLARTRDRKITLGRFLDDYRTIPTYSRPQLASVESFIHAFDGPALEPERLKIAKALKIDQDPVAVAQIEGKREEMLVEHLLQDSVTSHVVVTPAMRQRYYQTHLASMVSTPRVRYARFLRPNLGSAEALLARLHAGESPEDVIRASAREGDDSTGVVLEVRETDHDEYQKILFEELRPGQATRVGPDREGKYLIFQVLEHEPARQLSFQEAESSVDEVVRSAETARLRSAFVARLERRYVIEAHPELVMRIQLTDPIMDMVDSP